MQWIFTLQFILKCILIPRFFAIKQAKKQKRNEIQEFFFHVPVCIFLIRTLIDQKQAQTLQKCVLLDRIGDLLEQKECLLANIHSLFSKFADKRWQREYEKCLHLHASTVLNENLNNRHSMTGNCEIFAAEKKTHKLKKSSHMRFDILNRLKRTLPCCECFKYFLRSLHLHLSREEKKHEKQ